MVLPLLEVRHVLTTVVVVVGLGKEARFAVAFWEVVVVPAIAINNCHNLRELEVACPLEWKNISIFSSLKA